MSESKHSKLPCEWAFTKKGGTWCRKSTIASTGKYYSVRCNPECEIRIATANQQLIADLVDGLEIAMRISTQPMSVADELEIITGRIAIKALIQRAEGAK